ncbi:hypothetical protein CsSME_00003205 [Camellia sinensis var. sinensis]
MNVARPRVVRISVTDAEAHLSGLRHNSFRFSIELEPVTIASEEALCCEEFGNEIPWSRSELRLSVSLFPSLELSVVWVLLTAALLLLQYQKTTQCLAFLKTFCFEIVRCSKCFTVPSKVDDNGGYTRHMELRLRPMLPLFPLSLRSRSEIFSVFEIGVGVATSDLCRHSLHFR